MSSHRPEAPARSRRAGRRRADPKNPGLYFVKVPLWMIDHPEVPALYRVYYSIMSHARDGFGSFVGNEAIAADTRLEYTTVSKKIKKLLQLGWLTRRRLTQELVDQVKASRPLYKRLRADDPTDPDGRKYLYTAVFGKTAPPPLPTAPDDHDDAEVVGQNLQLSRGR